MMAIGKKVIFFSQIFFLLLNIASAGYNLQSYIIKIISKILMLKRKDVIV